MSVHAELEASYGRLSVAYAELGLEAPAFAGSLTERAAVIRRMTDVVNGRRNPEAGVATRALPRYRRARFETDVVAVEAALYDKNGLQAGRTHVMLDSKEALEALAVLDHEFVRWLAKTHPGMVLA